MAAARDSGLGFDAAVSEDEKRKAGPQAVQRLTRGDGSVTVKSQLTACRDSLMAGMRAASRGATPDERAGTLLRACLDLVEHMARQSSEVSVTEVNTTLNVLEQALGEMERDAEPNAASIALRNAIGRLQALRSEIGVK